MTTAGPVVADAAAGRRVAGEERATATDPPAARTAVRVEIQALRAIAVLAVVVYHLWPSALPGGFVGVDVFFAISGLLITTQLLREIERRGTVSMPRFWAKRARRLLPAALVTLVACALATALLVPTIYWQQYFGEIAASTAYFENWRLAGSAVDYLRAEDSPSPVQHFWSLSVEEQFYLVWPGLIVLATLGVRSRRPQLQRRAIAIVLSVVTALSLAYSIHATSTDPAAAFFVTPTRAWEFGAGGLLALLPLAGMRSARARSALSWLGLAAIMFAVVTYSATTAFPGWRALIPVLGALAVMHAGAPRARWAPTPILAAAPMQVLGNVSYSLYLWHWPLIVFAPFALSTVTDATRVVLLTLSVILAWLTKTLVEDPARRSTFLAARGPRATFAVAGVATAIIVAAAVGANLHAGGLVADARGATEKTIASKPACFGAAARDPERPCTNPELRLTVVPSPAEAASDPNAACARETPPGPLPSCRFGAAPETAKRNVAVLGDSHASVMRAPVAVVAEEKGWAGVSVTRTGCAYSAATKRLPGASGANCIAWNKAVPAFFAARPEIDTVFVAAITNSVVAVPKGKTMAQAKVDGYLRAWRALPETVEHIVVIRDPPKARGNTLRCVAAAIADRRPAGTACRLPRTRALVTDPQLVAAQRFSADRVSAVDMSATMCDASTCFPVVGGVLVYKDEHHLTRTFATTLGPLLLRDVNRLSRSWAPPTA